MRDEIKVKPCPNCHQQMCICKEINESATEAIFGKTSTPLTPEYFEKAKGWFRSKFPKMLVHSSTGIMVVIHEDKVFGLLINNRLVIVKTVEELEEKIQLATKLFEFLNH